jgi:hypothetical protein
VSKNGSNVAKRPLEDWVAQTLRVTLFPVEADWNIDASHEWWQTLFGDQPDCRSLSPKFKNLDAEGTYAGGSTRLSAQLPRVDWFFITPQSVPAEESRWGIGPFVRCIDEFVGPMIKWLEIAPLAARLALGVVAILPVADLRAGYHQLTPYLPCVKLNPDDSQNFFYQINRRRQSNVLPELTVNRLANWSVAAFMNGQFILSPGSASVITAGQEFGCVLQLDINSDPEPTTSLKRDALPRLFHEFVELAHEIVAEGDIG